MNKFQKKVCKALYKENCYILVSATKRDMDKTFGEFRVKAHISFLYDNGRYAAEWEPEYGPIQIWEKCYDPENATVEIEEHYFFDYTIKTSRDWSQMAVDKYGLPRAFEAGDYDYIFNVLKDWSER